VRVPAVFVGGADPAPKATAVVTTKPNTTASVSRFLTVTLLGSFRD
jgi:hypothetical protein